MRNNSTKMRNYHYYDGKYRDFVIRSLKHKSLVMIVHIISMEKAFSDLMMDIDKYPLRKYLN